MANFDQRNQNVVGNQYNASRDMTIQQGRERSFITRKSLEQPGGQLQQTRIPPEDEKGHQEADSILFCYAREDEQWLNRLKNHLMFLQRQNILTLWYDRDISPGAEWKREIAAHLNTATIIVLLISPDFMASDYCYSIEMKQALKRHEQGTATVVPIILRPVHWQNTPLSKLQVLPADAQPVVSSGSRTPDEAFLDITEEICRIIGNIDTF